MTRSRASTSWGWLAAALVTVSFFRHMFVVPPPIARRRLLRGCLRHGRGANPAVSALDCSGNVAGWNRRSGGERGTGSQGRAARLPGAEQVFGGDAVHRERAGRTEEDVGQQIGLLGD